MLKNIALIAASAITALLAAEVGMRIAGVSYPSFYEEDADLGDRLRPGAEGWARTEGGSFVRINSDGMRDSEHTIAKPPGTIRIAVLGDSFAEAMHVPQEQTFWSVLGRELSACAQRRYEVLNFGVSGYGTAQELLMLRSRVWKYSPDIVLLAFFSGNDVRNNSAALNHNPAVPYFVYKGDGLALDESYRAELASLRLSPSQRTLRSFAAVLRNQSRVLQVVNEARIGFHLRDAAQAVDKRGEAGLDNAVYSEPQDKNWKEAWQVTEGLIAEMANEVRSHGARFWVVTLSTGIQVYPDPAVREAFMKQLGVKDLLYPDMRVRALCERENIPVITLAPVMANYAQTHKAFLHGFPNATMGFGHWNQAGNELAGKLIAAHLCPPRLAGQ
jgi:hypothetical protein